ncbi:MAG: Flp family type IVb pilin [Geminicoccaceae bacterium]
MSVVGDLYRDQDGATAIQYALIAGVVVLALLVGSLALRGSLASLYQGIGDQAIPVLAGES